MCLARRRRHPGRLQSHTKQRAFMQWLCPHRRIQSSLQIYGSTLQTITHRRAPQYALYVNHSGNRKWIVSSRSNCKRYRLVTNCTIEPRNTIWHFTTSKRAHQHITETDHRNIDSMSLSLFHRTCYQSVNLRSIPLCIRYRYVSCPSMIASSDFYSSLFGLRQIGKTKSDS